MRLIDADALIEFCAERWIPLNIDAVNMQPTIQPEKAQLSKEGTTSDLISRQAVIDAVEKMNIPEDMCVFEILSHIEVEIATLPTIQPEKEQLSCGGTTSDTISRQWLLECVDEGWIKFDTEKDANRFIHLVRDIAPTAQPVVTDTNVGDIISRQAAIDALDCISGVEEVLRSLPPAQPEREEGEWVQIQRCVGDTQPDLECPFCKHRIGWWDMGRYCAGCGAKLEGGAG